MSSEDEVLIQEVATAVRTALRVKDPDAEWVNGLTEEFEPPVYPSSLRRGSGGTPIPATGSESDEEHRAHVRWVHRCGYCLALSALLLTYALYFSEVRSVFYFEPMEDTVVQEMFQSGRAVTELRLGTLASSLLSLSLLLLCAHMGSLTASPIVFLGSGTAALALLGSLSLLGCVLLTPKSEPEAPTYLSTTLLRVCTMAQWFSWSMTALLYASHSSNFLIPLFYLLVPFSVYTAHIWMPTFITGYLVGCVGVISCVWIVYDAITLDEKLGRKFHKD